MNAITEQIKPETLALIEQRAKTFGMSVDEYLESILPRGENDLSLKPEENEADFETDMNEFAEETDKSYKGNYSCEDIYFDRKAIYEKKIKYIVSFTVYVSIY